MLSISDLLYWFIKIYSDEEHINDRGRRLSSEYKYKIRKLANNSVLFFASFYH